MAKANDVMLQANLALKAATNRKKELLNLYRDEEKVPMYLSPMYRAHFGNVMNVSINGITIFFKVDGTTQLVPKTFAEEIGRRRVAVDSMLSKTTRMADLPNNVEQTPGELKLF